MIKQALSTSYKPYLSLITYTDYFPEAARPDSNATLKLFEF